MPRRLRRRVPACLWIVLPAAACLAAGSARAARLYATDRCVSDKLRAAGDACESVLRAYAVTEHGQDQDRLDAALGRTRIRLAKAWKRAEARAARETDCAETTAPSADVAGILEDAAGGLAGAVNDGLDLSDAADARCGAGLLAAAERACGGLLRAESQHLRQRASDRLRLRLSADQDAVRADFQEQAAAVRNGCPTGATTLALADQLDDLVGRAVAATTISPAVDDQQFEMITPQPVSYLGRSLTPICSHGTPFVFFAKRGTVNKVLVYFQGGGACWNSLTCNASVYKREATADDNPDLVHAGFGDRANPENPFKDWSVVMIPYCTGDVHWGDATKDYPLGDQTLTIQHKGAVNARVVEKWARDHFVMPDQVFVTGSSAGAYGAIANAPYLMEFAWPSSPFLVLGDAGNGVITNDFLVNDLSNWGIEKNVPRWIKALDVPLAQLSIVDLYVEVARQYPWNRFATYATAYDGGSGGQTGFYNIMVNGGNPVAALQWWESTCAWDQIMREQDFETFARTPGNFRYYIGTGSRHTMWGSDKVYTDTTGGVPTLVDWVDAMIAGSPDWTNVECQDCGTTLPGDPKPDPLPTPPFDASGNVVCDGSPPSP